MLFCVPSRVQLLGKPVPIPLADLGCMPSIITYSWCTHHLTMTLPPVVVTTPLQYSSNAPTLPGGPEHAWPAGQGLPLK